MLYYFINTPYTKGGSFLNYAEELVSFPAKDLNTIDYLWKKYSNGHFGFSIQKEVFTSFDTNNVNYQAKDKTVLQEFLETVGWVEMPSQANLFKGAKLTFDLTAPLGHLPSKALTWGLIRTGSKLDSKKTIELMEEHMRRLFSKLSSVSQEV